MTSIERQCENEMKKRLNDTLKGIKELKDKGEILASWYYKQLLTQKQINNINEMSLKDIKAAMREKAQKDYEKALKKELNEIANIKKVEPIKHGRIEAEWVNNRTWGNCPRGDYRNCFYYKEYKSVTGCGYDKLSTLTASMLNEDPHMKSFLFNFVEKHHINKNNIREKLGYGIRISNGQPYFEGAVGVECHVRILKNLGFNVNHADLRKADLITFDK